MSDSQDQTELTALLDAAAKGDRAAKEVAAERVYSELHRLAQQMMRREANHTLQATALVNEAFLKLFEKSELKEAPSRAYFFAAAAESMRRMLVEAARRRKAIKRGGDRSREVLDDQFGGRQIDHDEILDLHNALCELEKLHSRQAKVVEMRWFAQYTVAQVAEILNVHESTVEQDWRVARAFLKHRLQA